MALSELQVSIVRELAMKGGLIEGLPVRPGVDNEKLEQAIEGLVERKYVTVVGPPNQNSYLGKDVGELRLLPFGVGYLRMLR